jgi:hypothetical protein
MINVCFSSFVPAGEEVGDGVIDFAGVTVGVGVLVGEGVDVFVGVGVRKRKERVVDVGVGVFSTLSEPAAPADGVTPVFGFEVGVGEEVSDE